MAAILFSPVDVELVLADLPVVAALLPHPTIEGQRSEAFPALRKTEREVYRWIAGTRYPHLAEAVALLERVHAAGCTFDGLLATKSRAQFVGHSGELLVADDLIRRGYRVAAVPRSELATPDLHVTGDDGIDVAIEVYSPRELIAVDDWVEEVKALVDQIDLPADYTSRTDTQIEQATPPDRRPNSWEVADMVAATHDEVLATISSDVEVHLRELRSFSDVYRHGGTPLTTTVELEEVHASSAAGPARTGTISWPGFGGYSPAGVFAKIVDRTKTKATKRQALGVDAAARALVVNLTHTKIADDLFRSPAHMAGAEVALTGLEPLDYGLDVIAFVARVLPQGFAALLMVTADDGALTLEQAQSMFWHRA